MINDSFTQLRGILEKVRDAANDIQEACLKYGKCKSQLQLEIYRLIESNDPANVAKMIFTIAQELDKSDKKVTTTRTKFFSEE